MASASGADTFPHDYRVLFSGDAKPVVVGGQAVNLWAITYLQASDPSLAAATKYGSKDLDVLHDASVRSFIQSLPGWRYEATPLRNWADTRTGIAQSVAPDGRILLVELLSKVHGLDTADFKSAAFLRVGDTTYRLLDPVAMLKAKAANVRDLAQDDTPPRHDRDHLKLLARCLPLFLRDVEQSARDDATLAEHAGKTFSRAFAVLSDAKTAATLRANGIEPQSLMPADLAHSPIAKIAVAYKYQMPRLAQCNGSRLAP